MAQTAAICEADARAAHRPAARSGLRGRFPFRVGTTSYILPDDIIPNVRFLAPLVDDIEIVLFESAQASNLPGAEQVRELRSIADRWSLTYTIHMPLDADLSATEETQRRESVERYLRIAALAAPLAPFAYVTHPAQKTPAEADGSWADAFERSVRDIIAAGIAPELICVETLGFPFERAGRIVAAHGLSVCLDIGHMLAAGLSTEHHLDNYLPATRVLHLHGVRDGKDHRGLAAMPVEVLREVVSRLGCAAAGIERVATIEVFSATDLAESLDVMEGLLP